MNTRPLRTPQRRLPTPLEPLGWLGLSQGSEGRFTVFETATCVSPAALEIGVDRVDVAVEVLDAVAPLRTRLHKAVQRVLEWSADLQEAVRLQMTKVHLVVSDSDAPDQVRVIRVRNTDRKTAMQLIFGVDQILQLTCALLRGRLGLFDLRLFRGRSRRFVGLLLVVLSLTLCGRGIAVNLGPAIAGDAGLPGRKQEDCRHPSTCQEQNHHSNQESSREPNGDSR